MMPVATFCYSALAWHPLASKVTNLLSGDRSPRLLAQLRQAIRVRHYSRRTEEAYVFWVRRYVRFCGLRHPGELGPMELRVFLTALAERERLSAASQNQAASALVFLYERVLGRRLSSGVFDGVVRAKEG